MTPGRFVTLEGGEGVGKSTQSVHITTALERLGKQVVLTREPGGTLNAEAVRSLLMTGATDRWSARAEALLFAAARADHVERVIAPALARGDWVICDRYIDSTRAYQGGAGGMSDDDVIALHTIGADGLLPDRTLLFRLPEVVAVARQRQRGQRDRFGDKDADYHARLRATFDVMAASEPRRFRIVDAEGAEDDVTARAMSALSDLL